MEDLPGGLLPDQGLEFRSQAAIQVGFAGPGPGGAVSPRSRSAEHSRQGSSERWVATVEDLCRRRGWGRGLRVPAVIADAAALLGGSVGGVEDLVEEITVGAIARSESPPRLGRGNIGRSTEWQGPAVAARQHRWQGNLRLPAPADPLQGARWVTLVRTGEPNCPPCMGFYQMMVPAQRGQIAQARSPAAGKGNHMIQIAGLGLAAAAGEPAGAVQPDHHVPQRLRGLIGAVPVPAGGLLAGPVPTQRPHPPTQHPPTQHPATHGPAAGRA